MTINPQAVLGYTPLRYEASIEVQTASGLSRTDFLAERNLTSGRYAVYAGSSMPYVKKHAELLGIEAVSRQYTQEDVCRLLHALNGRFTPNEKTGRTAEFCTLLQAQVEAFGSGLAVPQDVLRAQGLFEVQADVLLKEVQARVYPSFKIATITNPIRARALSKRREGVFLWPDWRDSRYANVVMNCEPDVFVQVRDLVLDWSESSKVRLNPRFSF